MAIMMEWYFGWKLGAFLAVLNVIFSVGGMTLQKLSYKMHDTKDPFRWRRANGFYFFGVTLYMLAAPLDVLAVLTTTLTVVASVLPLNIVLAALFAWMWLDAQITAQYALGIFLCSVGSAVSMTWAPKTSAVLLNTPADFFVSPVVEYMVLSTSVCVYIAASSYRAAPAYAIVIAWVYSVERMFSSGMRTVVNGPLTVFTELRWVWMPLCVVCFGFIGLFVNLRAVKEHSTHTLVPLVIGCLTIVMAIQSLWLGEVRTFDAASRFWFSGVMLSTAGFLLVKKSDMEEARKAPEHEPLLRKKQLPDTIA